jgi:septum formation protein
MSDFSVSSIVLASGSASRKAMLSGVGVAFEAIPADIDERALEAEMAGSTPAEIAQALAAAKAAHVSGQMPATAEGQLVLGSDSLVEVGGLEVDGRRFDKPGSREEAADHLRFFAGKTMTLHSAAALAKDGQIIWVGSDFARMAVRNYSEEFIAAYLDAEWPAIAGCAGAFRIEAAGPNLFSSIIGDQFTVLGMPLLQVLAALREHGAVLA